MGKSKKIAFPYVCFNTVDEYQKPVNTLKEEYFFSELENGCHSDGKKEGTRENIKILRIKNGKKILKSYLKSDGIL